MSRLRDPHYEHELFRRRALLAAVLCVLATGVLWLRLLQLQVFGHQTFTALSQENRIQVVPLPPPRGLIYDRRGRVLADNVPSFDLVLIPERIADLPGTIAALQALLPIGAADVERFWTQLRRHRPFEPVALRHHLSEAEVARFAVDRHRFPGVDVQARLTRRYPFGALTAHVLGYVGRIDEDDRARLDPRNYRGTTVTGKLGVERAYEDILHGRVGHKREEVNVAGRPLRELPGRVPPQPGAALHLHLDLALQRAAADALGDRAGAVVALEPNTGAVRVLLSQPGYDPHAFVIGLSTAEYRALTANPARPLFDRALRGQYPPGSTIKPALALAALATDQPLARQPLRCPGFYRLPGVSHRYRDWKTHGPIDLPGAIEQSCDVFFYRLAEAMGIEALAAWLGRFGLGRPTGIDLPGERAGLVPTPAWKRERLGAPWYPGETLIAGIGQGYMLATPLQLAQLAAALATGNLYRPRLAAWAEYPDGRRVEWPPEPAGRIDARPEHWAAVRRAMIDVVHGAQGTARGIAHGLRYRIAGKTGTAQVISIDQDEEYDEESVAAHHRDHAWFIAWAPAEAPELALAVLVEHGGSGSAAAAPVARKVFDAYFASRD